MMDEHRAGLDLIQVRRAFDRAAATYAQAAVVPREVERRMAEKLDYLKLEPARVVDAGVGVGSGFLLLRRRYPKAEFVAVDFSIAMLRKARSSRPLLERMRSLAAGRAPHWVCADFSRLPLQAATIGMVWSNLSLAWTPSPLATLKEFHRVLAPGGALMLSSYGPDTLKELKSAFQAGDPGSHVHAFVDMHDLGDMLVAAGFDAPVMEMEEICVTYADAATLARDLKLSGQTCAASDRRRGLTTPRVWRRMEREYEKLREGGRLPVTMEIVYGHAWRGQPRAVADGRQIVRFDLGAGPPR
jgi:malonyl-CoA O-methyltransferase